MGQMDGKVAIVTGSGRGIGREIALRLVRDGARVVINDIDEAPAKETIAEIVKMGGKAVACNGDVAKPDFGDRIVKTAVDAFGDCHVVVNNAGYTWDSVIQKMSDEQWYAILDVHLTAPFRVLRAFQQHFRQQVEKERAAGKRIVRKVVNISSTSERSFSTAWRKCCWKARRTRKGAVRWTSRMAYHCSSLIFWMTESQV